MMDQMTGQSAATLMTSGGDARIVLDPATGLNRYYSAPRPSDVLAYASSTANDISTAAYAHVESLPVPGDRDYAARLETLRGRIRRAYAGAGGGGGGVGPAGRGRG